MYVLSSLCGVSELAERFATCPPPGFARLLLYLRKALDQLTLADMVAREDVKPSFVAAGVVRPPQRNKGGDRAAGGGHSRRWARRDRCGLSKQNSLSLAVMESCKNPDLNEYLFVQI
jgi:hypothetical protein